MRLWRGDKMKFINDNFFSLIKYCLGRVKDELLYFGVLAILLMVQFVEHKTIIFTVFLISIILYLVKIYFQSKQSIKNNRHLENFAKYLNNKSLWDKRHIDHNDIFFYRNDNEYKIESAQDAHKTWTTKESWMEIFPDPHILEYRVYLKYGETKIYEMLFVSCDGGRYFIPLPSKRLLNPYSSKKPIFEYYWVKNSLEYQVGEIIGEFYYQNNLDEVATFCKIKIVN